MSLPFNNLFMNMPYNSAHFSLRTISILLFLLLAISKGLSQSIDNPKVLSQNDNNATIKCVELSNDETVVTISINNVNKKPISISSSTTLVTKYGDRKPIKKMSMGKGWLEFGKKYHPSQKIVTLYLYFDKIASYTSSIDIDENCSGGRYWKGISLQKPTPSQSQTNTTSSNKSNSSNSGNKDNSVGFSSVSEIRNYLASRIDRLEPIEGEYDVQLSYRTNSPFQSDGSLYEDYIILKHPDTGRLHMFSVEGNNVYELGNPRIEEIGSTNIFRLFFGDSSNRAILQNNIRLTTSIELSLQDARLFSGNSRFSYRIILDYDMIKKYPTVEMYINAARKTR